MWLAQPSAHSQWKHVVGIYRHSGPFSRCDSLNSCRYRCAFSHYEVVLTMQIYSCSDQCRCTCRHITRSAMFVIHDFLRRAARLVHSLLYAFSIKWPNCHSDQGIKALPNKKCPCFCFKVRFYRVRTKHFKTLSLLLFLVELHVNSWSFFHLEAKTTAN